MSKWEDFIDDTLQYKRGYVVAYAEPDGQWHIWRGNVRLKEGVSSDHDQAQHDALRALNTIRP